MATMCFTSCSSCKKYLIITHCSHDLISNIDFITLINALDLAHCAEWALFPSMLKHRSYFPGEGSMDDCGVVVVFIASPKYDTNNSLITPNPHVYTKNILQ